MKINAEEVLPGLTESIQNGFESQETLFSGYDCDIGSANASYKVILFNCRDLYSQKGELRQAFVINPKKALASIRIKLSYPIYEIMMTIYCHQSSNFTFAPTCLRLVK
jgi:hypothetical protein